MVFEFTYYFNYFIIVFYIGFSFILSFFLVFLAVLLRYTSLLKLDLELSSAYECGFIPFDKKRTKLEVKFFMVALLFVIFDLEVIFILPWSLCLHLFSLVQFFFMFVFLLILVFGFFFEIKNDVLSF